MKPNTWLILWLPATVLAAGILIAWSLAAPNPRRPGPADGGSHGAPGGGQIPGRALLRATLDAESGTVTIAPSAPEAPLAPETVQALRRDTEGLRPTYHPDGAVSVHLRGRFQSVSVARIGPDGKWVICSENADQLNDFTERGMNGPPAPTPTAEVR